MNVVDQIVAMFATRGDETYFGEPVSQKEHALQAAHLAEQEGAPDTLVVAALLHDSGHLLHGFSESIADEGVDGRHESVGGAWLERHFSPEVTEPVRLHVAAKRYLCAVDAEYLVQLSPASIQSLSLQGGPLNDEERRQFEQHPFYREAVSLRRWDDQAKVPGLAVPDLEYYRSRLQATARRNR
jgi:[1-hydroxy-2-(trimethylamino)ethyl]phosphonate dioxygenase